MRNFIVAARVAALAVLGVSLLVACSKEPSGDAAQAETQQATGTVAPPVAAVDNMVAAVSTGKPGAPIAMKFEIATKPKVGEPLEIRVRVTAQSPDLSGLQLVFQSSGDLQIKSGGDLSVTGQPDPTKPIDHTIVVTPLRDGIYYLSAVAVAEGAGAQARTFSIPLVVGDAAILEAAKAPPPADTKGERVSSLPAAESGSKP